MCLLNVLIFESAVAKESHNILVIKSKKKKKKKREGEKKKRIGRKRDTSSNDA